MIHQGSIKRISSALNAPLRRSLSSQLTAEDIKAGEIKAAKSREFLRSTTLPRTITNSIGSGNDLVNPKNIAEIAVFNGMPSVHSNRTVVIAPRLYKTLQSGDNTSYQWEITWKNQKRWSNPLMGWTSSADPMAQVKLQFDSRDDAIEFAKKNGWKYETRGSVDVTTVEPGNIFKKNILLYKIHNYFNNLSI